MQLFGWFRAGEAKAFGQELAAFLVKEFQGDLGALHPKGRKRADKALAKAAEKVQAFRSTHRVNVYRKSQLANAFLWSLKEAGWPEQDASRMTDWLTLRL